MICNEPQSFFHIVVDKGFCDLMMLMDMFDFPPLNLDNRA